jgi:hypothetical protein
MTEATDDDRTKKERSPSFPFISLRKAVQRAQAFFDSHRKEPTRIAALADTWGYSPSSSGLQQTIAAMKQFGLLEDTGSGPDRKLQISDLARTILADLRFGAKEAAIKEAAQNPKIFAEYLSKWVPNRPSDAHCVSELVFDRNFAEIGAKAFLKVFDDTVAYARLGDSDISDDVEPPAGDVTDEADEKPDANRNGQEQEDRWKPLVTPAAIKNAGAIPLSERLQVVTTGNQLTISAALVSPKEVDKLIRILQANKELLDDNPDEPEPPAQ